MNPSRLSTLICASILFSAPLTALVAAQPGPATAPQPLMLIAADDTRSEGRENRSAKTTAMDAAITAKVKAKLMADDEVKGSKIDVDTYNKVVMLSGTADTEAQMMKALTLAAQVEGVASVTNHLTVPGATLGLNAEVGATGTSRSAGTTVKDAAISTTVKSKLLADPDVAGMKIDVDTRNKVVVLSGTVASQAQANEAELIASKVDGVASVNNQLKVAQ